VFRNLCSAPIAALSWATVQVVAADERADAAPAAPCTTAIPASAAKIPATTAAR
jgi:hypothetical protein